MTDVSESATKTVIIERKVRYLFWLNLIPFGLGGYAAYIYFMGQLQFNHVIQGIERILWLAIIAVSISLTFIFLTLPFSINLRRASKRSLKKTFPYITGEAGFIHFLLGIPLLAVKLVMLFASWMFNILVILIAVASALSFVGLLVMAIMKSMNYDLTALQNIFSVF